MEQRELLDIKKVRVTSDGAVPESHCLVQQVESASRAWKSLLFAYLTAQSRVT